MRRTLTLLVTLALLVISAWQWLPIIQAGWSIRDDYRFVKLMGPVGRISVHDFIEQLNPPDWQLGSVVNRPVYYVVHDVWMLVIGNHLHIWQSAKVLTFLLTIGLFFLFFARQTELIPAALLTSFVAFQPAWSDIVPRANSELFALLGFVTYGIGNLELLRRTTMPYAEGGPRKLTFPILLVASGGIIGVASKENFCFTILFCSTCLLIFALVLVNRPALAFAQVVPLVVSLIFCGLIFNGIKSNGGHALYGETFDLTAISTTAVTRFIAVDPAEWLLLGLFIVYFTRFLITRKEESLWAACYQAALIGVVLLNFGFYTGLPITGRYLFPENLMPSFSVLPLLAEVRRLRSFKKILCYSALALSCVPIAATGFKYNQHWSVEYRNETKLFESKLKKVVAVAVKQPRKPILFESYGVSDLEPLLSVKIYLSVYGVQNPEFAKLYYSDDQFQNPHEKYLARLDAGLIGTEFKSFSEMGTTEYIKIAFSPPSERGDTVASFYGQE